jgi:hypothetical protein
MDRKPNCWPWTGKCQPTSPRRSSTMPRSCPRLGLSAAAGPLIGGLVTCALSWRAPFGLQLLVVAWIAILGQALRRRPLGNARHHPDRPGLRHPHSPPAQRDDGTPPLTRHLRQTLGGPRHPSRPLRPPVACLGWPAAGPGRLRPGLHRSGREDWVLDPEPLPAGQLVQTPRASRLSLDGKACHEILKRAGLRRVRRPS